MRLLLIDLVETGIQEADHFSSSCSLAQLFIAGSGILES